jgi:hypothetical protein
LQLRLPFRLQRRLQLKLKLRLQLRLQLRFHLRLKLRLELALKLQLRLQFEVKVDVEVDVAVEVCSLRSAVEVEVEIASLILRSDCFQANSTLRRCVMPSPSRRQRVSPIKKQCFALLPLHLASRFTLELVSRSLLGPLRL